jgi:hypothetical protein
MPATTFPEYARSFTDVLDTVVATGEAVLVALQVDQRSVVRGLIAGALQFDDRYMLHFREFVDVTQAEPKIMYAYHKCRKAQSFQGGERRHLAQRANRFLRRCSRFVKTFFPHVLCLFRVATLANMLHLLCPTRL